MEGGLQELEETAYWLELLADSGIVRLSGSSHYKMKLKN